MNVDEVLIEKFKPLSVKLPKFPDGRLDYSNSDVAIVVTIFVRYKNEILLLKRSDRVRTYKGKWNTVAGYVDELKPIKEKVLEELREETGIDETKILRMKIGKYYEFFDEKINKKWIVFPVLVDLKEKVSVKLDWEHVEFRWIKKDEIEFFDTVPNLKKAWTTFGIHNFFRFKSQKLLQFFNLRKPKSQLRQPKLHQCTD